MKRKLLFTLVLISTFASINGFAQSKLIHYWHFNNATTPGAMYTYTTSLGPMITGIAADYSLIDTSKAKIWYHLADAVNTNPLDSTYIDFYAAAATENDTFNARMGAASGNAIKARNPSAKMELRFYMPTTGYKNLLLKYGTEASSHTSGQLNQNYDYSVDSGTTWKTSGLSMAADTAGLTFGLISLGFGADTTVNSNSKFVFRIKFSGNDSGYSGNNRFDNVTLDADTMTAATIHVSVANVTAPETVYTIYPNPVKNNLEISADADGVKGVMIYDAAGKTVFAGLANGKAFSVNVADLQAGVYFLNIREGNTGKVSSMKFVKE